MAFDAFIKIDGIAGEALDSEYEGWIEITGYSFGNTQPTSSTASSAGGAGSGRTKLTDFTFTKTLDKSSVKLLGASCAGDHIDEVVVAVHRSGGDKVKYLEIILEEVIISNYSLVARDGLPHETVQLNFGRIKSTYTQQSRSDGSGGGNIADGWDQIANRRYS
jgi:type VI secretion system secreted protein Hcp